MVIKCKKVLKFSSILCCLIVFICESHAQVKEPYQWLHGGSYSGAHVKESPDPLIAYRWDNPKASDSLQIYTLSPKKIICIPKNSFKIKGNEITVLGKGNLMFDFGTESAAWFEFDSNDLVDSVEASISEYNEPEIVSSGAQHRFKTAVPVKYGYTYRLELNKELYEGVRFAWIHVKTFSKIFHIKNVRLICQIKPVNYNGSFSCSDPELTRIWYTGAYTVKLNLLQNYFGAILIERGDRYSWTGDDYPAEAASMAAFGNYGMIRKTLTYTADDNNGIPAYSLYWVLSLIDYFNYTGDTAFFKKYIGTADTILTKSYKEYDHLPWLAFMGWSERLGGGFENPEIPEAKYTYRMLCIDAWKQFAKSMSFLNKHVLAEKYDRFAEEKAKLLEGNRKRIQQFGIFATSEAVDAGLGNIPEIKKQSKVLFANRLQRLSVSPFNQYFIIQAMATARQFADALTTVRDCWGGQIKYGGTTFFEVYRPSWNGILKPNDPVPNFSPGYTSLCHPWSAGVTKWLSENILGIKPVQPGFKSFAIIPYLDGRKLTWVKGAMPTPFGSIAASFNTKSGRCAIEIPEGTEAKIIALPKAGRQISNVTVNDRVLKNGTLLNHIMGIGALKEDRNYLYLLHVQPGKYKIQVTYSGVNKLPNLPVQEFNYAINSFTQDSLTSGDWEYKYGQEGYMLFGYPKSIVSKQLPDYIDTVILRKTGTVVWDSLSAEPYVLNSPPDSKRKIASAIITKNPIAGYEGMIIDVKLKENHPCRLSLYFLDLNKQHRRSAVAIFDLKTLNLIAPVQMVRHYEHGKYLSFSFNRSIRIAIEQVRGKNAAVSGMFFDKP